MSDGFLPDLWKAIFGESSGDDSSFALSDFWQKTWGEVESPFFRDRMGAPLVMEAPDGDPYAQDYDRILAIQQKGSKGYRTFDVDPFNINQEDYPCTIPNSILGNLFGFQDGMRQFARGVDTDVSPFWRTLEITANATWVRFEILPPRVNDKYRGFVGASPTGPVILGQSHGPTFPDTGTGRTTIDKDEVGSYSINHNFIVQFDSTDASPLIVKHGDVFKIPFNTIFVSFKQWSPRFRITVGYNTEAVKEDSRLLATRPAFFGGDGLLSGSEYHFVPFSITSGDLNGSYSNTLSVLETTGLRTDELLRNPIVSGNGGLYDHGSSYVWLRRFTASGRVLLTGNAETSISFGLYVFGPQNPGGPIVKKRRVMSLVKTFFTSLSGAVYYEPNFQLENATDELVRVRLGYGDSLRLLSEIESSTANQIAYFQFDLEGYSLGALEGQPLPVVLTPITPFDCTIQLSEEQYPMDVLSENTPGALT